MVPKHRAAVLSNVSDARRLLCAFWRKYVCWMSFLLARAIALLAVSSMLANQQYIVNNVSLNQNTHKVGLCIDQLEKNIVTRGSQEPNLVFLLGAVV